MASGAQFATLPLVKAVFDLCRPLSSDVPVLSLNQLNNVLIQGSDPKEVKKVLYWCLKYWFSWICTLLPSP